jgi:uncharacterized protein with von Willebrand factor type A (vWA) domain
MSIMTDAVVILDRSVLMRMKDLYYPARRGASTVARHISSQTSHRLRAVIGFAETASDIDLDELDEADFDPNHLGTNLMAAVALGQERLDHRGGRLIAFSHFEPTACTLKSEGVFFSYPPNAETIDMTLKQILAARDDDITVDAFCADVAPNDVTRGVLSAMVDAGGRVVEVGADDCDAAIQNYLEREGS